jgi:rRNA pseudouridine-1189 N-methylase Emg1 (Nep1/Mra1 family)
MSKMTERKERTLQEMMNENERIIIASRGLPNRHKKVKSNLEKGVLVGVYIFGALIIGFGVVYPIVTVLKLFILGG